MGFWSPPHSPSRLALPGEIERCNYLLLHEAFRSHIMDERPHAKAVKLTETRAFAKFDTRLLKTPFPGCKSLEFGSDEYWACTARHITTNLQHQSGTCKMGLPSDPEAVVDPELQIHGIRGLRVVDASIMPVIPAGHTNAIVFMIGEKASDLIKASWAGRDDNDVRTRRFPRNV